MNTNTPFPGGMKPKVIWLTGLSGSGKTTLARKLREQLAGSFILDGDEIRKGLNKDLGFSEEDRKENIRRVGEVARLFIQSGMVVITAFISPFRSDRDAVRKLVGEENFIEVYLDCPLAECEKRDVKGLYKLAREGKVLNFTGISSPYEPPEHADLTLHTASEPPEVSTSKLLKFILPKI